MQEAVKLMAAICLVPPDGHEKTLEAITIAGEMKGAGGAGGGERFGPIVQGLLVGNEQLRTNCMTLINAIITSPDDLDFRMHLRNEFLREGLLDVLDVSVFFSFLYVICRKKRKGVFGPPPPLRNTIKEYFTQILLGHKAVNNCFVY